jgi:hypothetical protein
MGRGLLTHTDGRLSGVQDIPGDPMRQALAATATALALSLSACGGGGGGSTPIQPQYQPLTDSFEFQLTNVQDGDGSLTYTWQNSGTKASVDRSSAITAGDVTLTLRDAANTVVYQGALGGASGSVASVTGTAGAWTVVVDFTNTTGTINFRCQKQ